MVSPPMKRSLLMLVVLVVVYIGSYVWFRSAYTERWDRDGRDYVIFPQQPALYYLYRHDRARARQSDFIDRARHNRAYPVLLVKPSNQTMLFRQAQGPELAEGQLMPR